jgi:hypothetical protein
LEDCLDALIDYRGQTPEETDAGIPLITAKIIKYPAVKIGDVRPSIIGLYGCSYVAPDTVAGLDRFRLSRGDLLVGMTGYVGETGLVPSVEPAAYLNHRVGRMATKSGLADIGYVYCAARSSDLSAIRHNDT